MGGKRSRSTSSRRRARARTRSSPARTATSRPTSRSRRRFRARPSFPRALAAPEEVETPGVTTCEALAELPRHRRRRDLEGDAGDEATTAPSCSRSSAATTGSSVQAGRGARRGGPARRPTRRSARRSAPSRGSLGPVGFKGEIVADETLREGQFVAGANRTAGTSAASRRAATSKPRFADLRVPKEGDRCPHCGGALRFQTAIEVGHIFKLGTPLLGAARRDVPRRGRARRSRS